MRSHRWKLTLALVVALCLTGATSAAARWAVSDRFVPASRLIKNMRRQLAQRGNDAHGWYVLGRLYSLQWALDSSSVQVMVGREDENRPLLFPGSIQARRDSTRRPSKQALAQADSSIAAYGRATTLAPTDAPSWLGLGWMRENAASQRADSLAWYARALDAYRHVFALTEKSDADRNVRGPGNESELSLEGGEGIVRLLSRREQSSLERAEVARVERAIALIEKKPMVITPIVIAMNGESTLASLLDTSASVRFDLAGDGDAGRWPWLKLGAALLVWDPEHAGRITSGRQLFGSVTWWIAWRDGYEPLAMLDDDDDGTLAGAELAGLAIWRDLNGDGVSQPGEVVSVKQGGIDRIVVRASLRGDGVPSVTRGAHLTGGRWVATWDWTPTERARPVAVLARAKNSQRLEH